MSLENTASASFKKPYHLLSIEQVEELNREFNRVKYPKQEDYEVMAEDLGIDEEKVKKWFRRKREKPREKQSTSSDIPSETSDRPLKCRRTEEKQDLSKDSDTNVYEIKISIQKKISQNELTSENLEETIINELKTTLENRNLKKFSAEYNKKSCQSVNISKQNVKSVRKIKVPFTQEQVRKLNEAYGRSKYPTSEEYKKIADNVGTNRIRVKSWFSKRRQKEKLCGSSKSASWSYQSPSGAQSKTPIPRESPKVVIFFTQDEVKKLNETFSRTKHPTTEECKKLADDLGVTEKKVERWFASQRYKEKLKNSSTNNSQSSQVQSESISLETNTSEISASFTKEQLEKLNEEYCRLKMKTTEEIQKLALNFGVSEEKIRSRFNAIQSTRKLKNASLTHEEKFISKELFQNSEAQETKKTEYSLNVHSSKINQEGNIISDAREETEKPKKVINAESKEKQLFTGHHVKNVGPSLNLIQSTSLVEKASCQKKIEVIVISDSEDSNDQAKLSVAGSGQDSSSKKPVQSVPFVKEASRQKNINALNLHDPGVPELLDDLVKLQHTHSANNGTSSEKFQPIPSVKKILPPRKIELIDLSNSDEPDLRAGTVKLMVGPQNQQCLHQSQNLYCQSQLTGYQMQQPVMVHPYEQRKNQVNYYWPEQQHQPLNYEWSRI